MYIYKQYHIYIIMGGGGVEFTSLVDEQLYTREEGVWFTSMIRLEAKSEKGPRNHFRGDGMLEDVTHASSPD